MIRKKLLIIIMGVFFIVGCNNAIPEGEATNQLYIPPLIDSRETQPIALTIQHGHHQFYADTSSETMGFNGDYLGPTIRLYKGDDSNIIFTNEIDEPTTVHGHGLHVDGDVDGGPQQRIDPNHSWEIEIPVRQEAGTSWYHPHWMGKTAEHVYNGLAGIYIIEDENSNSLDLPKTYGVNDVPLVIQDRSFTNGQMDAYAVTNEQMEDGLRGDTLVVNGTIAPYHNVPQGWVRLRLLNGSNARFYRFFFRDEGVFYKIATDGGFLNEPVPLSELTMAPGERNEIMVDLSNRESIQLMAEFLPADPEDQLFFMGSFNRIEFVVELRTSASIPVQGSLPEKLNDITFYTDADIEHVVPRTISLDMDNNDNQSVDRHSMFSINGASMDMSRINERVNKGELEVWHVTGNFMPHPFHIHGVSFQILSHGGEPPAEADRGWKDTVIVGDVPTVLVMRFNYTADEETPYMYHCHMLEHEDGGMMGQFTVE